MSRKKFKKRWNNVPIFSFTEETVQLVQRAIALIEQPLQMADHTEEKVAFAEELIRKLPAELRLRYTQPADDRSKWESDVWRYKPHGCRDQRTKLYRKL